MPPTQGDEEKLRELILYVVNALADDRTFGSVKLNKVLFFADFLAYQDLGEPITDVEYMKLDHGPAPRRMLPVRDELFDEGAAAMDERTYLGHRQKRVIALREADLSRFSPDELKLVDEIIEACRGQSAAQVSELAHSAFVGWRVATRGETIPYTSVFLSTDEPTEEELENVDELIAERGWG